MIADEIPVVDTDSHLTEPSDLWMSRLPTAWRDIAPQVRYVPERGEEYWFIGGRPTHPAWTQSRARWRYPPPSHPRVFAEVDPSTYDPSARSRALDDAGIALQVLYPNIVAFQLQPLLATHDLSFATACVQAYNDHVGDFSRSAPGRFIPIMALPFWDLERSLAEVDRGIARGHRGIVFANRPEVLTPHPLIDPHWDPLWAKAQEAGLSINFHVGFGEGFATKPLTRGSSTESGAGDAGSPDSPPPSELPPDGSSRQLQELGNEGIADYRLGLVRIGTPMMLSNSNAFLDLILAGVCERFPDLRFVSVESGWGYVPFMLASADWNWSTCGAADSWPRRLLPSEYFRRQCFATFWHESDTVTRTVDLYADNVMFETDFPHTVALMPGSGPELMSARETIEANLANLPLTVLRKILSDNARRVYLAEPNGSLGDP